MRQKNVITLLLLAALFMSADCTGMGRQSDAIRIMTYNLHHCEGEDGIYDVKRIARFIKKCGADIVLCQEVDNGYSDRSNMDNQPEMLAEMLDYHMFYGPNIGETYGNLILSRYPIKSAKNVQLPNPDKIEPRGLIDAEIDIAGFTFRFLDTHLSAFSKENRAAQIAFLRSYLTRSTQPVVFGADFNTRPSEQLKPLLSDGVLVDTRERVLKLGEGIDDLLVLKGMEALVTGGEVVENIYSDHPAYWIDIAMSPLK